MCTAFGLDGGLWGADGAQPPGRTGQSRHSEVERGPERFDEGASSEGALPALAARRPCAGGVTGSRARLAPADHLA